MICDCNAVKTVHCMNQIQIKDCILSMHDPTVETRVHQTPLMSIKFLAPSLKLFHLFKY